VEGFFKQTFHNKTGLIPLFYDSNRKTRIDILQGKKGYSLKSHEDSEWERRIGLPSLIWRSAQLEQPPFPPPPPPKKKKNSPVLISVTPQLLNADRRLLQNFLRTLPGIKFETSLLWRSASNQLHNTTPILLSVTIKMEPAYAARHPTPFIVQWSHTRPPLRGPVSPGRITLLFITRIYGRNRRWCTIVNSFKLKYPTN